MSTILGRPPTKPARRGAKRLLSSDEDVRSVQIGLVLTLLLWPLMVWLFDFAIRNIGGEYSGATNIPPAPRQAMFNVELAPEEFVMPNKPPPPPPKFVETNPDAPENIPDNTSNFGAQNQQAAQETPTPEGKSDRPATEGKKDFESAQIVSGQLTPPAPTPAPVAPPSQELAQILAEAAAARQAQNPLPGYEKQEADSPTGYGTNVAPNVPDATAVPEKVEGVKNAPLMVGTPTPAQPRIDPQKPQPRVRLSQQRARPAILADNKFGTQNIGPIGIDARWSNYGAYLQRLIEAVQVQWEKLIVDSRIYPPTGTVVAVKFRLESREGAVAEIIDVQSNGGEQAALICRTAIVSRAPYGPWTDDMVAVLGTSQEMTFTFFFFGM